MLHSTWMRLATVRELGFVAQSRAVPNTGWNGVGVGSVDVEIVDPLTMLFHEHGTWTATEGYQTPFTNIYRWTLNTDQQFIRLEHLRLGFDQPVHLFDLMHVAEQRLASAEPHVCRDDLYAAVMEFEEESIRLTWTITGPRKAETIAYTYR